MTAAFYSALRLGTKWFCQKKYVVEPRVVGVEVRDEKTGEWSFLILVYTLMWKKLVTWATHFASARQMAMLIKALSDSPDLYHPIVGDLHVRNVPVQFAEELGLPYGHGFKPCPEPVRIRLPAGSGNDSARQSQVQWVAPCWIESSFRA